MLKYKMTDNTLVVDGRVLHQIVALKDFGMIKKGDLGGWIEDYSNLSQEGRVWIADNACVYASARVIQNAFVCNNARIAGTALVAGDAFIGGNAYVCEETCVCGNAYVYGKTCVSGKALVGENARIYGNARVGLEAWVYENAVVCEEMVVNYSKITTDLRTDIAASLRGQCNLLLEGNKVRAYKVVNKDLTSIHDKKFTYKVGEIAEVENPDETNASCASGLHFSNLTYWDCHVDNYFNRVYLVAEIDVNDIITIQQGKIRCRKAKILNAVSI